MYICIYSCERTEYLAIIMNKPKLIKIIQNAYSAKSLKQKAILIHISSWIKITLWQSEHWIYRSVDRMYRCVLLWKNKQKTACKESAGAPSDPSNHAVGQWLVSGLCCQWDSGKAPSDTGGLFWGQASTNTWADKRGLKQARGLRNNLQLWFHSTLLPSSVLHLGWYVIFNANFPYPSTTGERQ